MPLVVGCWFLVVGALRFWVLGVGCWGVGCWVLVVGALRFWVLGVGFWVLVLTTLTVNSFSLRSKCEGH
jgi:hypothetical protein